MITIPSPNVEAGKLLVVLSSRHISLSEPLAVFTY